MEKIIELLKRMIKTKSAYHLYSFIKTYITVFLGIYLFGVESGKEPLDAGFIGQVAIFSLIAVLRNVYKILTKEGNISVEIQKEDLGK